MIPRELKLRIIGIVETEPAAGFGGMGRGRLLIPLQIAQKLRIAQPTDLREMLTRQVGQAKLRKSDRAGHQSQGRRER